jgi:hypothetical protein
LGKVGKYTLWGLDSFVWIEFHSYHTAIVAVEVIIVGFVNDHQRRHISSCDLIRFMSNITTIEDACVFLFIFIYTFIIIFETPLGILLLLIFHHINIIQDVHWWAGAIP